MTMTQRALMTRFVCVIFIGLLYALPCLAAKWYEGGNLHGDNLTSWMIATDQNQLATVADFVAGMTDPDLLRATDEATLKKASETVAACITTFAEAGVFDKRMRVVEAARLCMRDNQKACPFLLSKAEPAQKAAPPAAAITTEQLRDQVRELLSELDGFRASPVFKQCIYGCGKDNPGKAWNIKRDALQKQMSPQLDAPVELKAAPAGLWSLGMAYGKGKEGEAKRIRAEIEQALKE